MDIVKNKKAQYKPLVKSLVNHLLNNDYDGCEAVVNEALRMKLQPVEVYSHILSAAMNSIGLLWKSEKISIAHEHLATQMIASIVDMVADKSTKHSSNGLKAVVATTTGETHWMGAKVFSKLLELDGWEVHYLGYDTPNIDLVSYSYDKKADIVVISIVRNSYLPDAIKVVKKLRNSTYSPTILVGGPPVKESKELLKEEGVLVATDFISGMNILNDTFGFSGYFSTLEEILVKIGVNIQNTRKSRAMSQMELASIAGVDRAYISLVENGKQNITMSALHKFSEALGVSVIALMQ
jgi:methanogenic corrinoid protein MtbC1/DNA-binding XRE family transcriptional regulator